MGISDLVSVEVPYSLVDRRAENDMLSMCLKYNLAVLAYGVLGYGLLTGKYGRENKFGENDRRSRMAIFQKGSLADNIPLVKALREVGERYGKTSAQVAIRWALDNPAVTCVITGVKSPIQVEENTKAVNWSLSKEDRDMLAQSLRQQGGIAVC